VYSADKLFAVPDQRIKVLVKYGGKYEMKGLVGVSLGSIENWRYLLLNFPFFELAL
jgi:hypothetical protein